MIFLVIFVVCWVVMVLVVVVIMLFDLIFVFMVSVQGWKMLRLVRKLVRMVMNMVLNRVLVRYLVSMLCFLGEFMLQCLLMMVRLGLCFIEKVVLMVLCLMFSSSVRGRLIRMVLMKWFSFWKVSVQLVVVSLGSELLIIRLSLVMNSSSVGCSIEVV